MRGDEVAELATRLQTSNEKLAFVTAALNAYDDFAATVTDVAIDLRRCGLIDFSDPLIEALGDLKVRMEEVT